MQILGYHVPDGKVAKIHCPFGELPGCVPVGTDVIVVRGIRSGPVFYIGGGVHGDEVTSTAIVNHTIRRLSPTQMHGTVIAVPVQNSLAFAARHRLPVGVLLRSPMDQGPGNVFQSFPGDASGNMSQRIAAKLFTLMTLADYLVDIHTPTTGGRYLPFAFLPPPPFYDIAKEADTLAHRIGARVILNAGGSNYTSAATPHVAAAQRGVVGFGLELGEGGVYGVKDVHTGVTGLCNVLSEVGITDDGLPQSSDIPPVHVSRIAKIRADMSGELELLVELGDRIEKGQLVARVIGALGEIREECRAPVAGIYMRETTFGYVGTGDLICQIGE